MKSRFMKLFIPVLMVISLIASLSCSGNQAEELYKTAEFEELQNNPEHARKLYEEIIKKYPGSEYSKKAEDRLAELGE